VEERKREEQRGRKGGGERGGGGKRGKEEYKDTGLRSGRWRESAEGEGRWAVKVKIIERGDGNKTITKRDGSMRREGELGRGMKVEGYRGGDR